MARTIRKLLAPVLLVAALAAGHSLATEDTPSRTVQADTSWGTPAPVQPTASDDVAARAPQASGDTSWG
ncbi:hypothetical protein AB0I84_07790 [Streptomyces spectabilis]|uniref:hypothetical protein n=1 Tax=Streptomyces spectabilis TaxID=68270 RepID=UPI0033C8C1A7